MAKQVLIQPEQIESARKRLRELPTKESRKTKEEAATALAKDIRHALKKGYSLRDISELLKSEGVPVPASLIRQTVPNKRTKSTDRVQDPEITLPNLTST